jgi:hypothetical protein
MPDKPLPEWRVRLRRRIEEDGIDLEEFDKARKRLALRLIPVALALGAVGLLILANDKLIVRIARALGYRGP